MKILFALSVVSFLALLWAVYAMTRHVRRTAPIESDPALPEEIRSISTPATKSATNHVPPVRRSA